MRHLLLAAGAAVLSACQHSTTTFVPVPHNPDTRISVADQTCESQADMQKESYLSAIQDLMRQKGEASAANRAASRAPLDRFRAEVKSAHRTVVMRCKTHMQCLEANNYQEAACYISAYDRKDAERRFADLAYDLRNLEREISVAWARSQRRGANIRIEQSVDQTNRQDQTNTNTNENNQRVGDNIEDQDILQICGGRRGMLNPRCIRQCDDRRC